MGADLICSVALVIERGTKPDWDAAEKYLREVPIEELAQVFSSYGFDWHDTQDPEEAQELRDTAIGYLSECQSAYQDEWRNACRMFIRDLDVWFIGETSWGDTPEGYDAVLLTYLTGAAGAAGFDYDEED